jgi:hypothetical protein
MYFLSKFLDTLDRLPAYRHIENVSRDHLGVVEGVSHQRVSCSRAIRTVAQNPVDLVHPAERVGNSLQNVESRPQLFSCFLSFIRHLSVVCQVPTVPTVPFRREGGTSERGNHAEGGSLSSVWIEDNTIKCDACGRERPIAWTTAAEIKGVPDAVMHTYDKLGILQTERTYQSGVTAQTAARKLGWKFVGGSHRCPDCA